MRFSPSMLAQQLVSSLFRSCLGHLLLLSLHGYSCPVLYRRYNLTADLLALCLLQSFPQLINLLTKLLHLREHHRRGDKKIIYVFNKNVLK